MWTTSSLESISQGHIIYAFESRTLGTIVSRIDLHTFGCMFRSLANLDYYGQLTC